jgi:hypothetical protein
MICLDMLNKGFTEADAAIETPNDMGISEKPLNDSQKRLNKVDINVLKSRIQERENKEYKKNSIVLFSLLAVLGILGVYFSN